MVTARDTFGRVALAMLGGVCWIGTGQAADETLEQIITDGRVLFDGRLRYEFADQEGVDRNANALTFRSRFGFQTGTFHGLSALVEGDFTRDLGVDDFNSTTNGQTRFPVVADPNSERLNRLQLSYTGLPDTTLTGGRQRIKLDNDRFVGNVGFRQNEQTYDAVRVTNTTLPRLTVDYSYLWQVNRIFGSDAALGEVDADSHLINLGYALPFGRLTGYASLIDLNDLPGASNQTFGARFAGRHDIDETWSVLYAAEYATQSEYGSNPGDFDLDYLLVEGGLAWRSLTVRGAFERLEGDGTRGFATPLATLHKFQGHADAFLVTPATGIEDAQVSVDYRIEDVPHLGSVRLAGWYHTFASGASDEDLGQEVDLGVYISPFKHLTFSIEYADFFGADTVADLRRLFVTATVRY